MPSVLITGSGRRIGRGLALEFARKGWDVIIHYNNSEKSAKETVDTILNTGRKSVAVKANVLSYEEIEKAFQKIITEFGIPNVLVNNAGIYPEQIEIKNITEEQWNEVMGVNLRSEFYFSKIFSEYAKENSRIVNIASLGGLEVWKNRIPYNVSKSEVIHLTKSLARELAPGIAVNCVCPGTIRIPEEPAEEESPVSINRIPMGRYGNVKDVFDAVYFFATASMFITGQILSVDGGYHDAR